MRVSSPAQLVRGDGLDSQERKCRDYAKYKGYNIVAVFSDNYTGGTADRPGIKAMLGFLKSQQPEKRHVIIVDDLSRFSKDVVVHFGLRQTISDCGGVLETPSLELSDNADGKMQEGMIAVVNQHQREKNAEQTRDRMRGRMMNGYWALPKPIGYKYVSGHGPGRCLVRDEPYASIIQEGLEGFASGRFQTQAEVKRFFENQPTFPKDRYGRVTAQRVKDILTRIVYSGHIEYAKWNVSLREGNHEGLISLETYRKVQDRLKGRAVAPARPDLNKDFPLRGHVRCSDCDGPLTAAYSRSKTGKHHPYYFCHQRNCVSYRKSIRRDDLEGAFESILETMQPSQNLFEMVSAIFKDAWEMRLEQVNTIRQDWQRQIKDVEKQIDGLVDRIVETKSDTVIGALEQRVEKLEMEKQILAEKIRTGVKPKHTFEEMFELAFGFLSNPMQLWRSEHLAHKRTVLKLAFMKGLIYDRKTGFRTPEKAFPFKVLEGVFGGDCGVGAPGRT